MGPPGGGKPRGPSHGCPSAEPRRSQGQPGPLCFRLTLALVLWGAALLGAEGRELARHTPGVSRRLLEEPVTTAMLGRVDEFQDLLKSAGGSGERAASWISEESLRSGPKELFVVEDDPPWKWEQRTLKKHGPYSFISYSAYRLSPERLTVVGIGAHEFRSKRQTQNCTWVWANGTQVQGILKHRHTWFNYKKIYEMVILDCWLREGPIANDLMDWEGGVLETSEPGYLKIKLDNEIMYPYREDNGYKIHPIRSKGPFQYNLAYCGSPMYGEIAPLTINEWIAYHQYHAGMDKFFLYDSGSITPEIRGMLRPLEAQGLVTITPFREILQYEVWAEGQFLAMTDCLYRNRETSKWIAYLDFDEYLEVPPPQTLPGILAQNEGVPYITHGCYNYNVDNCEGEKGWAPESGKFVVERMLLRAKEPHCAPGHSNDSEVCLDGFGHRKLIYNPRMVFQTQVHKVEWHLGEGVDLRTSEIRHAHFRGMLIKDRVCHGEDPHNTHSTIAGAHEWENPLYNVTDGERVTSVAEIARAARLCEAKGFKDKENCFPKQPM